MSKYLLNGWGWAMPRPKSGLVVYHTLTQEEFELESHGAISCVGHRGLANILGVEYNPEYIQLNVGDVALIASSNKKFSQDAKELPPGVTLEYKCVKILEEI